MKLICLIFIFFIFYTQLKDTRQQIFLQRNNGAGLKFGNFRHLHRHRLNVPPQETLELDKEIQCVSRCLEKPDCFSLNTKKTDEKFLCEFLNTSKYQNHDNLTKDDNYVHWYFGDPCLPHPCNNGKCTATDTSTRFTCDCQVWASGKQCERYNSTNNFALQKPTVQSTQNTKYHSSLAVDGNRFNIAYFGSQAYCASTMKQTRAWWRVDLQYQIPVARVTITGRASCCPERIKNFEITVSNSLVDEGIVNPKCGDRHDIGAGLTETITCSPPLSGRYLLVSSFNDYLEFCELEVYTAL